jgi:hypothetical protein
MRYHLILCLAISALRTCGIIIYFGQVFVPPRLLSGLIPDAFLDAYDFWEDEKTNNFESSSRRDVNYKRMLGYPHKADGEYLLILEIRSTSDSSRANSWRGMGNEDKGQSGLYHATGKAMIK